MHVPFYIQSTLYYELFPTDMLCKSLQLCSMSQLYTSIVNYGDSRAHY